MVYNGPAQQTVDPIALSIVHDPTPPSPLFITETPDVNAHLPLFLQTPSTSTADSPSEASPLGHDDNDKEVESTEQYPRRGSAAQTVDPPILELEVKESVHPQGTGRNILTEGTMEERDVSQPSEPQVPAPSSHDDAVSATIADPKRTVDQNPAPASSRASECATTTAASNPAPGVASTSRKSKGKRRSGSGQKQHSASGPADETAPRIQGGSKAFQKRRREGRRDKKRQVSGDVNASSRAGCESEAAAIPPAESNIAQPADVPGTSSASPINDGETKDEDEQNDQVIEEHFTCVAKMMPSELVSPSCNFPLPRNFAKDSNRQTKSTDIRLWAASRMLGCALGR